MGGVVFLLLGALNASAQIRLYSQETEKFRVVYYTPAHEYLAPLLIRSLENAARFDERTFGYRPQGKVTVLLQDFEDFGYGAAGTLPAISSRSESPRSTWFTKPCRRANGSATCRTMN